MSGRYHYREIRAGSTGVTIIVDHERETVWVAATVAGKCRSAMAMYHGPRRHVLSGKDVDGSPSRWRHLYWRIDTTGIAHFTLTWWTWLTYIVNEVRMGYRDVEQLNRWPDHEHHSPARKAELLAERIREHLDGWYRNG